MQRKSSINIRELNKKQVTEHNKRIYKTNYLVDTKLENEYFNYCTPTLLTQKTDKNGNAYQSIDFDKIENNLREKYKKTTKQTAKANQQFFKEAVINTDKHVNKQHFDALRKALKEKFNMTVLQLDHHKDEGHKDEKTGEIKVNYHAHFVFINADLDTGKSLRLNKSQLQDMQTVVAECLQMQRGDFNSKNIRLEHKEYRKMNGIIDKKDTKKLEDKSLLVNDVIQKLHAQNEEFTKLIKKQQAQIYKLKLMHEGYKNTVDYYLKECINTLKTEDNITNFNEDEKLNLFEKFIKMLLTNNVNSSKKDATEQLINVAAKSTLSSGLITKIGLNDNKEVNKIEIKEEKNQVNKNINIKKDNKNGKNEIGGFD